MTFNFSWKELKKLAERNDAMSAASRDELRMARKRVDEMSSELSRLKAQVHVTVFHLGFYS